MTRKEKAMKAKELVAKMVKHPLHQEFLRCWQESLSHSSTMSQDAAATAKAFTALHNHIGEQAIRWMEESLRSCLQTKGGKTCAPAHRVNEVEQAFWNQVEKQMPEFFNLHSQVVAKK